ncbi:hypothetical protein TVAG_420190 [Trichomonas vaginalis G3]|uniref:P/Homo B domain-containing protein n=1 Tax=Trichomonas vaginalis (strain ATCC PRA-98 / G3) TaxID=412133 RepID=A2ED42_TRIV3|nr:serine-type endopeptidase protein [Trichomonas vaginalis G3]EAY09397.1 hypothetical protein TVAG_420190 [Trichomonas vaginalis G3]KAI5536316.1 serine-type endopeptidase protein [Trichomonas vaginalis G3]|eukprot:XP_001321620.1 hypothetical protein [Trichomonas vaginalis G3]
MVFPQVSDLFYVAAMTATKVYPKSHMWTKNAFDLYFNRQFGFGRLNVKEMCAAFHDLSVSYGSPVKIVLKKTVNMPLPNEEVNFTFEFKEKYNSVVCVDLRIHSKKLSFGSLNPHVISPGGTRSELKLITIDSIDYPIKSVDLNSYQFLGENPKGNWTVSFRINDYSDHGTLETLELRLYCTKNGPLSSQINQPDGNDPYNISDSYIEFPSNLLNVTAAENVTFNIKLKNECVKKEKYSIWFAEPDGENRVPLTEAQIINNYTQVNIPYFPSVFKDQMDSILVIDSFSPRCLYSSRVKLNYTNKFKPGIISPKNKAIISSAETDLEVSYALQLPKVVYAKFTGSSAVSILSPDSKKLLKRMFQKNIGYIHAKGIVPNTKNFYVQISPASTNLGLDFPVMTIEMFIIEQNGKFAPMKLVNNAAGISFLVLFFVSLITLCTYRTVSLCMMK